MFILIIIIRLLCTLHIPYIKLDCKYKGETISRYILETLTNRKFNKVRPKWLINPYTNRSLELDGYNEDINIAFEYNGSQHYKFEPFFHKSVHDSENQIIRDYIKYKICDRLNIFLIIIPYSIPYSELPGYIFNKLLNIYKHPKYNLIFK